MIIKSKTNVKRVIFIFIILFLFLISLFAIENGRFNYYFKLIGIYPQYERYTVLFFVESEQLSNESKNNESLTFTFGIENIEGENKNYQYMVEIWSGEKNEVIDGGYIKVNYNEKSYKTIQINEISKYPKGSMVYVILPLNNKSIDFKLN